MSDRSAKLASPPAPDIIGMFARCNPKRSRAEVEAVGELVAAFGATAARLSPTAQRRLAERKARLGEVIQALVADDVKPADAVRLTPEAAKTGHGAGLGEMLAENEGRARVTGYATPMRAEEWAGPLAGPTELARDLGVARSTLHAWQKQGAVIGVQVGVRKHAFPIEQFVDGRPLAGLAPLVNAVGDTRTAWRWLREPNPGLDGETPLARLAGGEVEPVLALARSNFGGG